MHTYFYFLKSLCNCHLKNSCLHIKGYCLIINVLFCFVVSGKQTESAAQVGTAVAIKIWE